MLDHVGVMSRCVDACCAMSGYALALSAAIAWSGTLGLPSPPYFLCPWLPSCYAGLGRGVWTSGWESLYPIPVHGL
jgi:hypothetical protein